LNKGKWRAGFKCYRGECMSQPVKRNTVNPQMVGSSFERSSHAVFLDGNFVKFAKFWRHWPTLCNSKTTITHGRNFGPIKQHYRPMLGFAKFESASRFCTAFDELRNYLRVHAVDGQQVPASGRREIFTDKWSTLMTELLA
jgi:hypothetical protein